MARPRNGRGWSRQFAAVTVPGQGWYRLAATLALEMHRARADNSFGRLKTSS